MARSQSPFPVLSILVATLITLAAASPSPPPEDPQQEQLDKIIDALVGAGDFTNWADLLSSSAAPSDFPFSATFFVPADSGAAVSPRNSILNPFVLAYHIVPQRLSFSDLLLFKNHARLPTLLSNKSILITRNSSSNFTLDGTHLTRPDLYSSASVAVHAVASVLDFRLYGDPDAFRPPHLPPPLPPAAVAGPPPLAAADPPVIAIYDDDEYFTGGARSVVPAAVFLIAFCSALFLSSVS